MFWGTDEYSEWFSISHNIPCISPLRSSKLYIYIRYNSNYSSKIWFLSIGVLQKIFYFSIRNYKLEMYGIIQKSKNSKKKNIFNNVESFWNNSILC